MKLHQLASSLFEPSPAVRAVLAEKKVRRTFSASPQEYAFQLHIKGLSDQEISAWWPTLYPGGRRNLALSTVRKYIAEGRLQLANHEGETTTQA